MFKAVVTLYRPVGPQELQLIKDSGMRGFPPRFPEQPIFYPVLNRKYAIQIARDWNVPASGSGYVTEFDVEQEFLSQFEVQNVGGFVHDEYWIPAEMLSDFNQHIVGQIRITDTFK